MPGPGLLVVISAPSGAGKATVIRRLIEHGVRVSHPVSVTTRSPREGELDGREYYFRTPEEFDALLADNAFVEWAEVHGNRYGTLKSELERCTGQGSDVLLELDVQGMRNLLRAGLNPVTIFLLPPSMDELERRLRNRGKDSEETIALRLQNAREEISARIEYNHVIINDDIDRAVRELKDILEEERTRR
ncbi:MAG: hypothetical protein RLZZ303_1237 [Candidatus Hydrogenedentota bacterium]